MNVLKTVKNVENGQIIISLPKDFSYQKVEIIVLPYNEDKKEEKSIKNFSWNDITGIVEFNEDSPIKHDKYIGETILEKLKFYKFISNS